MVLVGATKQCNETDFEIIFIYYMYYLCVRSGHYISFLEHYFKRPITVNRAPYRNPYIETKFCSFCVFLIATARTIFTQSLVFELFPLLRAITSDLTRNGCMQGPGMIHFSQPFLVRSKIAYIFALGLSFKKRPYKTIN